MNGSRSLSAHSRATATVSTDAEVETLRGQGRVVMAGVLLRTLQRLQGAGVPGTSVRAIAERLGLSHTRVNAWVSEISGVGYSAGDVFAMGPEVSRAWARELLATLSTGVEAATDPEHLALTVFCRVAKLAEAARDAMADKRVTRGEWKAIEAQLDAIEEEVARARSAVRAALEASR